MFLVRRWPRRINGEILLRVFIENKQSMLYELSYDKDAEKEHRGTGKTTAIEKLAVEYDLPYSYN